VIVEKRIASPGTRPFVMLSSRQVICGSTDRRR
jgi:hypothetical protein